MALPIQTQFRLLCIQHYFSYKGDVVKQKVALIFYDPISFLFLLTIVNRSVTLCLSYKRAWSFYNVTNALKSQEQYHHRVLIDLTVFTTIFAITQLLSLLHTI